jgi:hypothetical protein
MIGDEDRVPRNVIDECARRGAAIHVQFSALLAEQVDRQHVFANGEWLLRHHAVMVLGLMATEDAALQLLAFMSRMSQDDDYDLQDWLAGVVSQ